MLKVNALFDKNPAFTIKQLEALVTPDVFEVIDWPGGIRCACDTATRSSGDNLSRSCLLEGDSRFLVAKTCQLTLREGVNS
jgi:hypothetical protein